MVRPPGPPIERESDPAKYRKGLISMRHAETPRYFMHMGHGGDPAERVKDEVIPT